MIVAIDGPAGSGKSTVARELARRHKLCYLDTGAMYRSVCLACLDKGVNLGDEEAVARVAQTIEIRFSGDVDAQHVIVDGRDVTSEIRSAEVDHNVSVVSAVAEVRRAMVAQQRAIAEGTSIVAEGRDIGTAVFPSAEVKVFLTADASARAHRRAVQREGGDAAVADATTNAQQEAAILADIQRRDKIDSTREVTPLKPADDAVHIDSSNLSVDEVCAKIEELMDAAETHSDAGSDGGANAARGSEMSTKTDTQVSSPDSSAKKPAKRRETTKGSSSRLHQLRNKPEAYYDARMREFPILARFALWVAVVIAYVYTKLMFRWRMEDGDKLLEATKDKGSVIVMNHVSMLDPVILVIWLMVRGRRVRPIFKDEFNNTGIMRAIMCWVGGIPVKRGTADIKAVRRAQRALQEGESILIYPEGTRVKTNEEPVEIHGGFALMAQMGKAAVVPTAIVGAGDITPRGKHVPRPKTVYVKAGSAIRFSDLDVKGRREQLEAMERVAMEQVFALREELRREHPGKE